MSAATTGWAQSVLPPLKYPQPAPPTYATSYEARVLKPRGVFDVDPNIYAYTAEFAKRFQMPKEWIASDLKGAEAVAFRVVPAEKTCGWSGDPNHCFNDEKDCQLDVYFDHVKQPLPWDPREMGRRMNTSLTSVGFLASAANRQLVPERQFPFNHGPFLNEQFGKTMGWVKSVRNSPSVASGNPILLGAYDREIFPGLAVLVFHTGCWPPQLPQALWLHHESLSFENRANAARMVDLPATFIRRMRDLLAPFNASTKAFLGQEVEKAVRTLQPAPPKQVVITPLD